MLTFVESMWRMLCEMSPYLLLGFFIAGLLQTFVPKAIYTQYLSKGNMSSVLKAALFGIPLPLCSCGVIPTAVSLRREGASRGATASFLIATPQTGVDSIAATYSLLGLPFAILRPVAALVTSVLGGWAVNCFDSRDEETHQECNSCATAEENPAEKTIVGKLFGALRYGFVDMMQDVGKWLVVGLMIAAAITVLVPNDFFVMLGNYPLLNMLIVLAISVPMYVCATGSIPIALSLMLKGLTPGAALVLLMAGPAINAASMLVVGRVMGKRMLVIYLSSLIIGSMAFGLVADYLLPSWWFELPSTVASVADCCATGVHGGTPVMKQCCAVALLLLLATTLSWKYYKTISHAMRNKEEETTTTINNTTMQIIKIEGMNCNHCRATVERALQQVAGVTSVTVSLEEKQAKVEGEVSADALKAAVESVGFTAIL